MYIRTKFIEKVVEFHYSLRNPYFMGSPICSFLAYDVNSIGELLFRVQTDSRMKINFHAL